MYEHITYSSIMKKMLSQVSAKNPNIDTREGSIIYNALAPAAVELQNMYIQLDTILTETFADTASRYYLKQRASERRVYPYPATSALLQGEFNIDVPLGSRFSLLNTTLNYVVTSQISAGVFKLQCEKEGSIGSENVGQLIPIDDIDGLTRAELTQVLIHGEDEEETEHFRQRYLASLNTTAFGGNIQDYKEKTDALAGVGGVKVYPAWNGGGTVKLVIVSSDYGVPSQELVDSVQDAIDPKQNLDISGNSDMSGNPDMSGYGIAPIGHIVTVEGAEPKPVDISMQITYLSGWEWAEIEAYAQSAIDEYLKELTASWADSETLVVRISQIETKILSLPGVLDVENTTLNGEASNLVLKPNAVPIRGSVNG